MSSDHIPFAEAVLGQPRYLQTAVEHISASLAAAAPAAWRPGETVAVLAMGASTNSGHALVAALTERGVRGANITASELAAAPADFEPADHYLVVTESGRSPEPLDAVRGRGAGRRVAITNFPDAAVSEVVDRTIGYGGLDDSPVYTTGYLATLASYAALIDAQGMDSGLDISRVPGIIAEALERFQPLAAGLAERFDGAKAADLVGRGFGYCSATQGALIFREALRLPATGWETYQFIHGPIESAGADTVLIVIGDGRELDIVPQLAKVGTRVIVLSAAGEERLAELAGDTVDIVSLAHTAPGFERTIVETVALQLITIAVAERQGISIEEFLYSQPDTKLPKPGETAGE